MIRLKEAMDRPCLVFGCAQISIMKLSGSQQGSDGIRAVIHQTWSLECVRLWLSDIVVKLAARCRHTAPFISPSVLQ